MEGHRAAAHTHGVLYTVIPLHYAAYITMLTMAGCTYVYGCIWLDTSGCAYTMYGQYTLQLCLYCCHSDVCTICTCINNMVGLSSQARLCMPMLMQTYYSNHFRPLRVICIDVTVTCFNMEDNIAGKIGHAYIPSTNLLL